MRLQDIIGQIVNTCSLSTWYPVRRQVNQSLQSGLKYRRFFYNLPATIQNQELLHTLQEVVRNARRSVPYYADLLRHYPDTFPESFAEYRALAPLDKATIKLHSRDLIAAEFQRSKLIACSTSGSTGEPTVVYSSPTDVGWRLSSEQFYYSLLDCQPGNRVGRFYGGSVENNGGSSVPGKVKNWFLNRLQNDCLILDEEYLMQIHNRFTKFMPDLIIAYSSGIYALALLLEKKAIRPKYPRKVILGAAEKLEPHQRATLERVFTAAVVERYGSREIGQMAFQPPEFEAGLQVDRCACLIEPDGVPDENGIAPMLITTLRNQAMPLLRYRIGDLARFAPNWTPEEPATYLPEIVGRTLDYIVLPENKKVFGGMIGLLMQGKDIEAYQVIQFADSSVHVKIVPGPNLNGAQRSEIQRTIRNHLIGVTIEFEYPAEIARTTANAKLRPVISHLGASPQIPDQQYLQPDAFYSL